MGRYVKGDPYWIKARYASHCAVAYVESTTREGTVDMKVNGTTFTMSERSYALVCEGAQLAENRRRLSVWLRTSEAYDVLDDAVMGCWPESEALELLESFGLAVSTESLKWLGRAIDEALGEGN